LRDTGLARGGSNRSGRDWMRRAVPDVGQGWQRGGSWDGGGRGPRGTTDAPAVSFVERGGWPEGGPETGCLAGGGAMPRVVPGGFFLGQAGFSRALESRLSIVADRAAQPGWAASSCRIPWKVAKGIKGDRGIWPGGGRFPRSRPQSASQSRGALVPVTVRASVRPRFAPWLACGPVRNVALAPRGCHLRYSQFARSSRSRHDTALRTSTRKRGLKRVLQVFVRVRPARGGRPRHHMFRGRGQQGLKKNAGLAGKRPRPRKSVVEQNGSRSKRPRPDRPPPRFVEQNRRNWPKETGWLEEGRQRGTLLFPDSPHHTGQNPLHSTPLRTESFPGFWELFRRSVRPNA